MAFQPVSPYLWLPLSPKTGFGGEGELKKRLFTYDD
jgi:hypothetical protein